MIRSLFDNLSKEMQDEYLANGGFVEDVPSNLDSSALKEGAVHKNGLVNGNDAELSSISNQQSITPVELDKPQTDSNVEGVITPPTINGEESSVNSTTDISQSEVNQFAEGFDIKDPLELLILLDENVASGKVAIHDWQAQFMLDFAKQQATDNTPFQAVVRACNGSGKDKFIIAPCIVWLCMRYRKARAVVTSASGVQLDNQTCAYITDLCNAANRKWGKAAGFGQDVWKVNYRKYECLATESPVVCYATDEPGKAEGFHPLDPGCKMVIAVSEDKSVPDEINVALNKCTGYTHRIHVSTPGNAFGHFYDLCSNAVNRRDIVSVNDVNPEDYIQYHIPAKMCPHLSESYIKQMKRDLPGGELGGAYKSQVEAEFAITDEMVVIPYTYIWKAKKKTLADWKPEPYNKAGLDLSDGGDETVLIVRNGNRVIALIPFRFDNTEDTVEFLQEKFREHKLNHPEALIFADCGGIGKPILDRLKRLGWKNIRYCDNRAKSLRPKTYKNWGAESWFHLGDLMKQGELILIDDPTLNKQLATRYFKLIDGAVHQLLSKPEMKNKGFPSPDRADALVLAFSDYKSDYIAEKDKDAEKPYDDPSDSEGGDRKLSDFTLKGWAKGESDLNSKYNVNSGQKNFSGIEDEIKEFNRQRLLATQ